MVFQVHQKSTLTRADPETILFEFPAATATFSLEICKITVSDCSFQHFKIIEPRDHGRHRECQLCLQYN
ncbi:hypothetical protein MATL_G00126280 [Megalops atlanticus]|uniref:Uncharacterized protein n=1 Tax=Megalops atlanticus TaxID=7932 RepID=A0A9D3PVJ8_MEGAT|nr:hypothetical protein MATL_G00126280 [Megalops atlanticus]